MRRFSFFWCCAIASTHKERSPKHFQTSSQQRQGKAPNQEVSKIHVRQVFNDWLQQPVTDGDPTKSQKQ
jgi:hypothetical protein